MRYEIKIKIEDKEQGFTFSMLTLDLICESLGIEFHEMIDLLKHRPFRMILTILQKANFVFSEEDQEQSIKTIDRWVDIMPQSDLQLIWGTFENSIQGVVQHTNDLEKESKKKLSGKTSGK